MKRCKYKHCGNYHPKAKAFCSSVCDSYSREMKLLDSITKKNTMEIKGLSDSQLIFRALVMIVSDLDGKRHGYYGNEYLLKELKQRSKEE